MQTALSFQSTPLDVTDRNNQPWLRAPQLEVALGFTKRGAINTLYDRHADEFTDSMTAVVTLPTPGGPQETRIFSLRGCHLLAMFARTSVAKDFRVWVLDVLESISKRGGYLATTPADTPEAIMARAVLVAQDTITRLSEKAKALEAQTTELSTRIEADRPKVLFAEAVSVSDNTITVGALAKLIKQSTGYDTGRDRLYEWFRQNGYVIKQQGAERNLPTQRYVDMGLFVIRESIRQSSSGNPKTEQTTRVTGKGQTYFINKFLSVAAAEAMPPPRVFMPQSSFVGGTI